MGLFGTATSTAVKARNATLRGIRQTYRVTRALDPSSGSPEVNAAVARTALHARRAFADREDLTWDKRSWCLPLQDRMPVEVLLANFEVVDAALRSAGIPAFAVRQDSSPRHVVAVDITHREAVLAALAQTWRDEPVYVQLLIRASSSDGLALPVRAAPLSPALNSAGVVRVWRCYRSERGSLVLGASYGAEIEFWTTHPKTKTVSAPRPNVAADQLTLDDVALVEGTVGAGTAAARAYPTAKVFAQRMIDDVDFGVDAVYTWVDGADPAWRERMARARAAEQGLEYHPQSQGDQRFLQRDELRYSLRSVEMFAPWIRHIYLVTDRQCPAWLDTTHPKITVIDHRDIFADSSVLPVFNSNAIISRLHHVPGLSEHYIYFNDDFFLGRPLRPNHFFTPSGLARVSPANNRRPFGSASAKSEPHINLTRNMRDLLEAEFGITISRAIKHTPYPQLRSVHLEMEERFAEVYRRTCASRFRHHEDIVADQLFHYYAQITAKAVVGSLRYDYYSLGRASDLPRLRAALAYRNRDVFCLNDDPQPGVEPMAEADVREFLEDYYPVRSSFERADLGT
ncbi:MAG: stealth family protein [Sporichthyaceae bacterium]